MKLAVESKEACIRWMLQDIGSKNAIGLGLLDEMEGSLKRIQASLRNSELNAPRLLLIESALQGSGKPIWMAGGHLHDLAKMGGSEVQRFASRVHRVGKTLQKLPIPVIALVDGLVLGGGIEFMLNCDIRFATEKSEFHFKQNEIGLTCGFGGGELLLAEVGKARASELLFLCRKIGAFEAKDLGIVQRVFKSKDELQIFVLQTIEHLRSLEPMVIAAQKKMLQLPRGSWVKERALFASVWKNPSHAKFLDIFCK